MKKGILNFHKTHVWVDDNPHINVAWRHQHWLSINVYLGILGDQFLGPVALPNRQSVTVNRHFLMNDLPVLLQHAPLRQQQMCFVDDGTLFSPNC
jgi:hypothetical protein